MHGTGEGRRRSSLLGSAVVLLAFGAAGCDAPQAVVEIVGPAGGAVVEGPNVRVVLAARGVEIAPASEERPGTGHHHLFVDRDLTPLGDTIPSGVSGILHLGRGQTEFVLEGLAPGAHRVIALLADWAHVPLHPPAADTVEFTVVGPPVPAAAAERPLQPR